MYGSRDLSGTELGGYFLERRLGSGASSTVYLARDGAGQEVAFKLLAAGTDLGERDGDARSRLRAEALNLQRLRIPGVAQVLDLEVDGADAFLVTEYVPGPTLAADIHTAGAWSVAEVLELGELLARVLTQVHQAGVLHRDIKPGNIILGPNGPVLIDFGISAAEGAVRLTQTGIVVGTPGFISPEVIGGKPPQSADDWWSLGATLLYALSGRAPFGTGTPAAQVSRVLAGNPDVAGLPDSLAAAFRQVLAPVDSGRADFEVLFEALQTAQYEPTQVLVENREDVMQRTQVLPAELNGRYNPEAVELDQDEWTNAASLDTDAASADTIALDAPTDTEEDSASEAASESAPIVPRPLPFLALAASLCWAVWVPYQMLTMGILSAAWIWISGVVGWHSIARHRILSIPAVLVKGLISAIPALVILVLSLVLAWKILSGSITDFAQGLPAEITIFGTLIPARVYQSILLVWVAQVILWWLPTGAPVRRGARYLIRALLPTVVRRALLGLILLGAAVSALILM